MKKKLLLCVLLCCFARMSFASPFLYFSPDREIVYAGEYFVVDVMIGGLRDAGPNALLGAYQMELLYDPRLELLNTETRPGTGLGRVGLGEAVVGSVPSGSGRHNFFSISLLEGRASECIFCTGPYLEDLQSDTFRLMGLVFHLPSHPAPFPRTLSFDAIDVVLSDHNGVVLAAGPTEPLVLAIPEPATIALMLSGLLLLILRRPRALRRPVVGFASLLACTSVAAQSIEIPLRAATVRLTVGSYDLGTAARGADGVRYIVVKFDGGVTPARHAAARAIGIHPVSFLFNDAWIARMTRTPAASELRTAGIVAATRWLPEYKLTAALRDGQVSQWAVLPSGDVRLAVRFFKDTDSASMGPLLAGISTKAEQEPGDSWHWHVEAPLSSVPALAAIEAVESINEVPPPRLPTNGMARAGLRVDAVQQADLSATPPRYDGLSGAGVNVAVSEAVNTSHPDFINHDAAGNALGSRFLNASTGSEHGTHVAGTIGGNGWNSHRAGNTGRPYQWRGMAPEATLISAFAYESFPVDVSNHSYVQSFGPYDSAVRSTDMAINGALGQEQYHPHVWAAANQGVEAQYDREIGYYAMFGPGKNLITVGALNASDQSLAIFSSLGPTFDGRVKPDVMAPGCKTSLPRSLPAYTALPAAIDYIRVFDPSATAAGATCSGVARIGTAWPVLCFEFQRGGDTEGWFRTDTLNIFNPQVADGLLKFDFFPVRDRYAQRPFGFVTGLSLPANPSQFLRMRYRYGPVATAFGSRSFLSWRRADGTGYIDGDLRYQSIVDGQFQIAQIPVGQAAAWNNVITALRIDPLEPDEGIVSTDIDGTHYREMCGTSMAAPAVTGTTALLLQRIAADYNLNLDTDPPFPSTLKAVLIQTATDLVHTVADPRDLHNPDTGTAVLYHAGPDFATGFGEVNAVAADALVRNGRSFDCSRLGRSLCQDTLVPSLRRAYRIDVPPGAAELRATLVWDDVAGNAQLAGTLPQLVNDLDLVLIDPAGLPRYAWKLAPLPIAACRTTPTCDVNDPIMPQSVRPATRGRDHLNNVEQVSVRAPAAGTWTVLVEGHRMQDQTGPQRFSLATSAHTLAADLSISQLTQVPARAIAAETADLNANACIDRNDLRLLTDELNQPAPRNASYDLNADGSTDIADARLLVTRFSRAGGAPCE